MITSALVAVWLVSVPALAGAILGQGYIALRAVYGGRGRHRALRAWRKAWRTSTR